MLKEETIKILKNSFDLYLKRLSKKFKPITLSVVDFYIKEYGYAKIVNFSINIGFNNDKWSLTDKEANELVDDVYKYTVIGQSILTSSNEKTCHISYHFDTSFNDKSKENIKENHFKSKQKLNLKVNVEANIEKNKLNIILDFIHFLNKKLTLHADVLIELIDIKVGHMTTGVRMSRHHIKVLCKHRMLVDILRTLAHEWTHEYQHQEMGVTDKEKKLEIGGWGENHANSMAGILLKSYVFKHKELENILF